MKNRRKEAEGNDNKRDQVLRSVTLSRCFSNLNAHQNHLGSCSHTGSDLVKSRWREGEAGILHF